MITRIVDGTRAMPRRAPTKPSVEVVRGAGWPSRGMNPAARQAATVSSCRPVPGGPQGAPLGALSKAGRSEA